LDVEHGHQEAGIRGNTCEVDTRGNMVAHGGKAGIEMIW